MLATDSAGNGKMTCGKKVALAVWVMCFVCFFPLQCNNPKTKEPKLTAAARIVPEWVEYDNEIKQLLRRAQEEEDTATQEQSKKSPSSSQHKKGEQRKTHSGWHFVPVTAFLLLKVQYVRTGYTSQIHTQNK